MEYFIFSLIPLNTYKENQACSIKGRGGQLWLPPPPFFSLQIFFLNLHIKYCVGGWTNLLPPLSKTLLRALKIKLQNTKKLIIILKMINNLIRCTCTCNLKVCIQWRKNFWVFIQIHTIKYLLKSTFMQSQEQKLNILSIFVRIGLVLRITISDCKKQSLPKWLGGFSV